MKLNKRLLALSEMVNQPYNVVWDCCCDHGLLGFKILANGLIKQVNFVDVVPELIDALSQKLIKYADQLPVDSRWQTWCTDVAAITLEPNIESAAHCVSSNFCIAEDIVHDPDRVGHLIIISGVGGELMIDILTEMMKRYSGRNIDFLLCPVQHTYKLRLTLIDLGFKLKQEQLVIEKNRGYELMLINQIDGEPLSATGDKLWFPEIAHEIYLNKLINHYQKINNNKNELKVKRLALKDYLNLRKRLYKNNNNV